MTLEELVAIRLRYRHLPWPWEDEPAPEFDVNQAVVDLRTIAIELEVLHHWLGQHLNAKTHSEKRQAMRWMRERSNAWQEKSPSLTALEPTTSKETTPEG